MRTEPTAAAPAVTILTDFGWQDPWLAELKGALHAVWARWPVPGPQPPIVDLAHDIPPRDVAAAGWFLRRVAGCWPPGTVHLAVVDPGVGTVRPALACRARGQIFVGPGNGLLAFLREDPDLQVVRLDRPLYRGHPLTGAVSATFEGRDVFAPAAAHLARGVPLDQVGSPGSAPDLGTFGGSVAGYSVVWIDRFGNAVTDLPRASNAGRRLAGGAVIRLGGGLVEGPSRTYADGRPGVPLWYWGSGGTLEVAVPGGSAALALGLSVGLALSLPEP